MNIDEAIKLQHELPNLLREVGLNKYIASTRLGIEALEREQAIRSDHLIGVHTVEPGPHSIRRPPLIYGGRLPSETQE